MTCFDSLCGSAVHDNDICSDGLVKSFVWTTNETRVPVNCSQDLSAANFQECLDYLCTGVDLTLNTDLAGVGIFISFIIQTSLALLGYIALCLTSFTTYFLLRLTPGISRSQAVNIQTSLAKRRPALISGLAEFHRTQCFLALATQIASVVAVYNYTLQSTSQGQALANIAFIIGLTSNNAFNITFVLLYLRRVTNRPWYPLTLSVLTAISCVLAAVIAIQEESNLTVLVSTSLTTPLDSCGGHDPTIYCVNTGDASTYYTEGVMPIYQSLSLAFMTYLAVEYAVHKRWTIVTPIRKLSKLYLAHRKIATNPKNKDTGAYQRFWTLRWFLLVVKIVLWGTFLGLLGDQLGAFTLFTSHIDLNSWSLGQVVGITIWAQPIMEFLQLEITGMRRGFRHRLPDGFAVGHEGGYEQRVRDTLERDRTWYENITLFFFGGMRRIGVKRKRHHQGEKDGGYEDLHDWSDNSLENSSHDDNDSNDNDTADDNVGSAVGHRRTGGAISDSRG